MGCPRRQKGYRGHNAPPDHKFKVFISGQKRGVTPKDQARIAPQGRRRACHRPSQSRAPHGPQLSLVPPGRRCQRRPRRRWLQLPPPHPLAQPVAAPNPIGSHCRPSDRSSLKHEFFTDDQISDHTRQKPDEAWLSGGSFTLAQAFFRAIALRSPTIAAPEYMVLPVAEVRSVTRLEVPRSRSPEGSVA